jgi:carbonic anhydrase
MSIALERFVAEKYAGQLALHDKPEIMLLTCMDYRYAHRVTDVMDRQVGRFKYDTFVLAGAALGGNAGEGIDPKVTVPPSWQQALVSHIQAARAIHHPISKLFILQHRQCGAFNHFLGLDWEKVLPGDEKDKHLDQVKKLAVYLKTVFSDLTVDAMLLTREEDDELCIGC